MRVVILAKEFPNSTYPVACNFIYEQAAAIAREAETFVIAPVYSFPPLKRYAHHSQMQEKIPEYVHENSLHIFHPRYQYYPSVFRRLMMNGFIAAASRVIREKVGSFDVLHAHFLHEAGFAGIKLSKKFDVPLVVTAHGSDVNRVLRGEEARKYETMRARKTLNTAQAVIAVSNTIKSTLIDYARAPEKIHRIYNGIDLTRFTIADKQTARTELQLPALNEKKIALFVGNILPQKGVFDFLNALKHLNTKRDDILAVFLGEDRTNGRFFQECQSMPNAQYIGAVQHELVARYMQAADVLVHPSHSEGFGLVVVESLACGCPVVAATVGAIPEIIVSEEGGILVEPSNSDMLEQAIQSVLNKKWKQQDLRTIAQSFLIEHTIQETFELYQELLDT